MNILEQSKDEEFVKEQFIKGCILDDTKDYGRTQFVDEIYRLQQENEQLKLINKEYERLDNGNKRGFEITSIKQYNIDELVRCKDNWNKLKEFLETNWKETQDIWFIKILNKMQELERGVSDE